jgi:hypothetical protein
MSCPSGRSQQFTARLDTPIVTGDYKLQGNREGGEGQAEVRPDRIAHGQALARDDRQAERSVDRGEHEGDRELPADARAVSFEPGRMLCRRLPARFSTNGPVVRSQAAVTRRPAVIPFIAIQLRIATSNSETSLSRAS